MGAGLAGVGGWLKARLTPVLWVAAVASVCARDAKQAGVVEEEVDRSEERRGGDIERGERVKNLERKIRIKRRGCALACGRRAGHELDWSRS